MRARHFVSVILAFVIGMAGIAAFSGGTQTPTDQRPQVVSPLGKRFFAKADTDGAIATADAALAAEPNNLDLLIAAARARDTALQFDASIAMYTKAIGMAPNDVRAYRFRGHRYISTRKLDLAAASQSDRMGLGDLQALERPLAEALEVVKSFRDD